MTDIVMYRSPPPTGVSFHDYGLAFAGSLWQVASLSPAFGHDMDRAVFDAMRFYMLSSGFMHDSREAIVRAFQDRQHLNLTMTAAVPQIEAAFSSRGIGFPPVSVSWSPSQQHSCGYRVDVSTGGVARTYSITFLSGSSGQNNDQSVVSPTYSKVILGSGSHGSVSFDVPSVILDGHRTDDGHTHALLARFTDLQNGDVGNLDYYSGHGPQSFCEEILEMSARHLLVEGSGEPPAALSVRQVVGDGLIVPSLRGDPSGGQVAAGGGLTTQIARNGLLSFDYGVPAHAQGEVTVRVYDLRGRLVRTIPTNGSVPGWTRITWDRHDDSGNPVTGGVYVAVVQAGTEVVRTRLIVPAR